MIKIKFLVVLLSGLLFLHASEYEEGEILFFKKGCTSCHGNAGEGLHEFPKIANIEAKKLRKKLTAYRADQIKTPTASIMTGYAKDLTPKEMDRLILYLSTLKKKKKTKFYDDSFYEWGDGGS